MKDKKKKDDLTEEVLEEVLDPQEDEILVLKGKIASLEECLLRNQAELQNYKRRKDEEVARLLKYSEEEIILEFLPILDNFERAINMKGNEEVKKFLEGFEMVYNQIKNMLRKFSVMEIEALDKPFNPNYHQAVITGLDEEKEDGIILEVMQKGYMYKDKVIRFSMVKVNSNDKKERNDK